MELLKEVYAAQYFFYIMINENCSNFKGDIERTLFADDRAIWKRGHNIAYVSQRLQKTVDKVEVWANKWSFRLSAAKTQVICSTKGKSTKGQVEVVQTGTGASTSS